MSTLGMLTITPFSYALFACLAYCARSFVKVMWCILLATGMFVPIYQSWSLWNYKQGWSDK